MKHRSMSFSTICRTVRFRAALQRYCRWLTLLLIAGGATGMRAQQNASVANLSLNGEWQFALAKTPQDAEALQMFWQQGFKNSRFQATQVPLNWSLTGFEPPHYGKLPATASEGFYLKQFQAPSSLQHQRVLLHFGGVWESTEVWLNGTELGRHDSGFTSFSYDVTHQLRSGSNLLAVRVRQKVPHYLLDVNDDWSLPGIYRDITLRATPENRWLDRVDVQTIFDDQFRDADLKVGILIGESRSRNQVIPTYELALTLLGRDGTTVATSHLPVAGHPGTNRVVNTTLHVAAPLHWTAETPNLYTLRIDLVENSVLAQRVERTVGFRQVSTAGGVFRVSGQVVKLRGVDRHDETAEHGRATTAADWDRDLRLMKAANINFVRTSHYPPAEGFLDLCDRLGMYVEDEVPMGYGGDFANDPAYAGAVMLRTYETVTRDLNHASILLWSVGNEDPLTAIHLAAIRTVKGLDPTRPVLMPWRADETLPPEIDILAPHYYTAAHFYELASQATRPIIATEYSHAFGFDGFGGLQQRWEALTRHPAGAGGAIWMWADQGLRPRGGGLLLNDDGFDGIVGSDREPQRDYWETRAVYAQIYPATQRIDLPFGASQVQIPIQNDFDFTDLSAVEATWRLMRDDTELSHGDTKLAGVPHSQTMLSVPLEAMGSVVPQAAYWVDLRFAESGRSITERSVELRIPNSSASAAGLGSQTAVTMQQNVRQNTIVVNAGAIRCVFNAKLGQLTSCGNAGVTVLGPIDLVLWRPFNTNDKLMQPKGDAGPFPDLNRFRTEVTAWRVAQSGGAAVIDVAADYIVNAENMIQATYRYTVSENGEVRVDYTVQPRVHQRYLPFVGLLLHFSSPLQRVRWLGLGPLDSYPNEQAAANFGVWSVDPRTVAGESVKTVRWAEMEDTEGQRLRIEGAPYLRIKDGAVAALARVAGRGSKAQQPESIQDRLSTADGRTFTGTLRFMLEPVRKPLPSHSNQPMQEKGRNTQ